MELETYIYIKPFQKHAAVTNVTTKLNASLGKDKIILDI